MKTIKVVVILMMLVFSLVPTTMLVKGAGPNFMGFATNPKDVTVGASFTTLVWVNVGSAIDTASVDNLTFLPAGKISYVSTAWGNLFAGSTVQLTPEGGGTINNPAGYAKPITWAHTISVNGVNRTLATITWTAASCGVVTTTITAGGTALGGIDPGTTKSTGTINVHPESTGSFNAVATSPSNIHLIWAKFIGDDTVMIRYNTGAGPAPTDPESGTLLYNNTGTSTDHGGLIPGDHVWYSAWGYNATANLYSISFQSDNEIVPFPNLPPAFGTPSPTNISFNQNLALTWSIPITDPEGDLFDFRISCDNGQFTDVAGATNGTKSLSLSLAYATIYTVWVNATDPAGSGLYTRAWYQFTTKLDTAPNVPTSPSPPNGATNVRPTVSKLECIVTDPEGDSLDVSFYWANGTLIGTDTIASGGTAEVSIPTLAINTLYRWYVNASDGILSTVGPAGAPGTNWSFTTGKRTTGGGTNLNDLLISAMFNGVPVPGTVILIYEGIGTQAVDVVAQASTGDTGIQYFYLADGTYTIHVAKPGYQEITKTITLAGNMAVVFNLQPLGAADYLLVGGLIFLLVIGLYLIYTVAKGKKAFGFSLSQPFGTLYAMILDVIVIVVGLYYFWLLAVAGVALLIVEILWVRWAS